MSYPFEIGPKPFNIFSRPSIWFLHTDNSWPCISETIVTTLNGRYSNIREHQFFKNKLRKERNLNSMILSLKRSAYHHIITISPRQTALMPYRNACRLASCSILHSSSKIEMLYWSFEMAIPVTKLISET